MKDDKGNTIDEQGNIIEYADGTKPDDAPADKPADDGDDAIKLTFKTDQEKQDWLDAQFKSRHKRMKDQAKKDAEEEIRKEVEAEEAKKQGNYQKLYEQAEETISKQQSRIQELEGQLETAGVDTERVTTLENQVKQFIAPQLERIDPMYRDLVDAMTLDQQAAWLTKHSDKLSAPDDPSGSDTTPEPPPTNPDKDRKQDDDQARAVTQNEVRGRL